MRQVYFNLLGFLIKKIILKQLQDKVEIFININKFLALVHSVKILISLSYPNKTKFDQKRVSKIQIFQKIYIFQNWYIPKNDTYLRMIPT